MCGWLLLLLYISSDRHTVRVRKERIGKKLVISKKSLLITRIFASAVSANDPMINLNFFLSYPFSFSLDITSWGGKWIVLRMLDLIIDDMKIIYILNRIKVQLLIIIFPPLSFISHLDIFEVKYECRVCLWIAFLAPPPSLVFKRASIKRSCNQS